MTDIEPKPTLVDDILNLGDRAFQELFPIIPTQWLQLDLTMPQLKTALLLFTEGPSRMSDIASGLGVSLATATGVVDRLVERELVSREGSPEDRRVVLCRLSPGGEELIGGLWSLARDRSRELLEALQPPQLQLLGEALEALLKAGEATKRHLSTDQRAHSE